MITSSLFIAFLFVLAAADWRLARRLFLVRARAARSSRSREPEEAYGLRPTAACGSILSSCFCHLVTFAIMEI